MIFKAGRGRKAALSCTVLGFAAYTLRDRIREEWWLYRLGSKDLGVRFAAANGLARLKSERAILPLLKIARDQRDHPEADWIPVSLCQIGPGGRAAMIEDLRSGRLHLSPRAFTYLEAFGGSDLVPFFIELMKDAPASESELAELSLTRLRASGVNIPPLTAEPSRSSARP